MPTLSGRVIEKWSGVPVSSAVVNVDGAQVLTDANGQFSVTTSSANVILQVMHVGYETLRESLTLSGDTNIYVDLTPTARAL